MYFIAAIYFCLLISEAFHKSFNHSSIELFSMDKIRALYYCDLKFSVSREGMELIFK